MKKVSRIVGTVIFGLAALYLLGAVILPFWGLEYRYPAALFGKVLIAMVIPLWLLVRGIWRLWQQGRENRSTRWLAGAAGAAGAVLYLGWCWLAFCAIAFSTPSEQCLPDGRLAVTISDWPRPVSSCFYEPVGFLFRRRLTASEEELSTGKLSESRFPVQSHKIDDLRNGGDTPGEYIQQIQRLDGSEIGKYRVNPDNAEHA